MNIKERKLVAATLIRAAEILEATLVSARSRKWEGKIVGRGARLRWDRYGFLVEELPAKGKKKLRTKWIQSYGPYNGFQGSAFIADNIIRSQRISNRDTYSDLKTKVIEGIAAGLVEEGQEPRRWGATEQQLRDEVVHYLKVEPENMEPFNVKAKDFTLAVSWLEFGAYSPGSDLQQHDPHYTKIVSKSPAAARKLYKAMTVMPEAIRNMPYSDFTNWLKKNKVAFDYQFSQWT